MKTTLRWTMTAGLALASGVTGLGHAAEVASPQTSPAITIHVYNYAGVPSKTMAEAEEVATEIFRKAGVQTRWADTSLTAESDSGNSADRSAFTLADVQLSIFPRVMSDRSDLPDNVMGLTPGTGPDRKIIYIFESNVETPFRRLVMAHCRGSMDWRVSKAQILGHAIAHELGHLLLNQQGHSARGIMRGEWGLGDFRDAVYGKLVFMPEQAEFLRADVRRRNAEQGTLKVAALESPALAR